MALTKIGKEGITGISNSANANAITIDSGENVALSGTLGVTGETTLATHLNLGDGDKIKLGDGSDLQIYHDGNSKIADVGGGKLELHSDGTGVFIQKGATEYMAKFETDGAVTLYHDNSPKLATTATGIDVTGTVTSGELLSSVGLKVATHPVVGYASFDSGYATQLGSTGSSTLNATQIYAGGVVQATFKAGNVGIGLSSNIDRKLHVENDNDYAVKFGGTASGDFAIEIGQDGSNGSPGFNATAGSMKFSMAGTERMRIDASGRVLVGKTSASTNTVGVEARSDGTFSAVKSGGGAVVFGRNSNDGTIVTIRKDGSAVGSIGVNNSYIYVGSGSTNFRFHDGVPAILPATSGGASRDAAIDFGASAARYKNLYLSSGVFLGGTGSANHLDDYEEGTWTPTVVSGTFSVTSGSAYYIKIGRVVTAYCRVHTFSNDTGSSDHFHLASLPFTISTNNREANIGTAWGAYMGSQRTIFFYSGGGNTTNAAAYHGTAGAGYGTVYHSTFTGGGNGTNMLIKLHYIST